MPYRVNPNPEQMTCNEARDFAARLNSIGIPVDTIYEVTIADRFDITNEQYFDDGLKHQYVAKVWNGSEQELALAKAQVSSGDFNALLKLAVSCGMNTAQAESAILSLPKVIAAVNSVAAGLKG